MKVILGGHWENPPEGWTALGENDQDITKPFPWDDNSVDAVFLEHVNEHLSVEGNIAFFKEALRFLRPGGVMRIVCPFIDKLVQFNQYTDIGKHYIQTQIRHYYPNEDKLLTDLGLDFINYGHAFMMDSLLKKHNHIFVWDQVMMAQVLDKLGFEVYIGAVGERAIEPGEALERRIRGIHQEFADANNIDVYDPESKVVEAIKR